MTMRENIRDMAKKGDDMPYSIAIAVVRPITNDVCEEGMPPEE